MIMNFLWKCLSLYLKKLCMLSFSSWYAHMIFPSIISLQNLKYISWWCKSMKWRKRNYNWVSERENIFPSHRVYNWNVHGGIIQQLVSGQKLKMSINARERERWMSFLQKWNGKEFPLQLHHHFCCPQIIFILNTVLFDGNSKYFSFSVPHAAPFYTISCPRDTM